MTVIHDSPSGPEVTLNTDVASVFGRTGAVVAVSGDYDTDQVDNASSVPGASFTDALLTLSNSDAETNASAVPGATVSDALDYLNANAFYLPGRVHDTFSGGQSVNTSPNPNANVGDFGWNVASGGSGVVGPSISKLSAVGTDAVGIYRCTSPSNAVGTPAGFVGILGSPVLNHGLLRWDQLAECTWRARFDPDAVSFNITSAIGFCNEPLGLQAVQFNVTIKGASASPNFQVVVSPAAGLILFIVTTVPVDHEFHDFRIVRVSDVQADFYIDGALVASVTDTGALPAPSDVLMPFFYSITGTSGAQTPSFVDVDDFTITPVAA